MRPVRPGDRGPAVEDIQRRLLRLGYGMGPTGVDGVFLGATEDAVRRFQSLHALDEDGFVGERTWATLVDATFTLGDRMLYLRVPHFHGQDVLLLQEALTSLGFPAGRCDGIFGPRTGGAVRDFQRNVAQPPDGIVGPDTVSVIFGLRHVWEGKEGTPYPAQRSGPLRAVEVLGRIPIAVVPLDSDSRDIAERVVNLAQATTADALTAVRSSREVAEEPVVLLLAGCGTPRAPEGVPFVSLATELPVLAQRILTALATGDREGQRSVAVDLCGAGEKGERGRQRSAVLLLDALCAALD